ncbi:hypothetical protein NQ317_014457 [Molorchus minor]|uniref:Uncharacterized protein n=1 Tax=Molorchus minor TaxID=1323400 RepID=A0ABQ9ITY6_9CUCU|nr:hypothetical protein NQ317_014457 [Molorchus minor]
MWKAAQFLLALEITYNLGIAKGVFPRVPGFTEFLYSFSTAVLFHAAILEPTNLRPSYWKFLHSISGGRIACMSRAPLDVWGLDTSESLRRVLEKTRTVPVVGIGYVSLFSYVSYPPLATAVFKLAVNGWRRHFRLSAGRRPFLFI